MILLYVFYRKKGGRGGGGERKDQRSVRSPKTKTKAVQKKSHPKETIKKTERTKKKKRLKLAAATSEGHNTQSTEKSNDT